VLWGCNVALLGFLFLFVDRLPYIIAQSKGNGAVNPGSTPSYKAVSASDMESPLQKAELPTVDNEPRQWPPV
jgi:hypothetical protein